MSQRSYRVLIVDGQRILREGLVAFLGCESDMEVVGEGQDGQEAIDLCQQLEPDVVLMDISMPVMHGTDATRVIASELPKVRVTVLSMFE